jgi:hypothetical protein
MKSRSNRFPSTLAALLLVSVPAVHAQSSGKEAILQPGPRPAAAEDEWRFTITPYLWLPSVDLDVSMPDVTIGNRTFGGDFSIEQPWWDTLSDFSSDYYVLSLAGRMEAWKGCWGGFIDGYWIFGKSTVTGSDSKMLLRDRVQITTSSKITNKFSTGEINFGPQYLLGTAALPEDSSVEFVLYGGGRVNWIGNYIDATLNVAASANVGAATSQVNFSNDDSRVFIEPMIGLKTVWLLGSNWVGSLRGDVGGFGWVENDNWDCDLEASLGWKFNDGVLLSLGYRARGQWEDNSSSDTTAEGWFFGPEVGLTWQF